LAIQFVLKCSKNSPGSKEPWEFYPDIPLPTNRVQKHPIGWKWDQLVAYSHQSGAINQLGGLTATNWLVALSGTQFGP